MKKFDANSFYNSFNITIKALAESERVTKDALRWLSRDCLMLLHYESNKQGDISPVNQILKVLTPRNKSAWVFFFKEFSGFHFSEKEGKFTTKNKEKFSKNNDASVYDVKCANACYELEDDKFDIWSWAKGNLEDRVKKTPIEMLGGAIDRVISAKNKVTGEEMYSKEDILRTVLEHGITTDDLITMLQAMDVVEVN